MPAKMRIACMTGTRADYPRVRPVLQEISKRPDLELKLIVTGTHLLKKFGYTIEEIEQDGFDIAGIVGIYTGDDSPFGMAKASARCADGVADMLNVIKPDVFLVTVDRVETLASANSAALMNIPIAHIQGGEVTGTIDESIRHAVTKLSHIHFPATEVAAERIRKMGEENVYQVGCPYLDVIRTLKYKTKKELGVKYKFNPASPLIIFIQHPVTTEYGQVTEQIRTSLDALTWFCEAEIIATFPNIDAGGSEILSEMENLHVFPNINYVDFLSLLKHTDVLVGNSSTGIREAPSFGLPVVNIGTRQSGRLRAGNVIDVPHDMGDIIVAIDKALHDENFKKRVRKVTNPYGDGHSAKRIVDILENAELSVQKRITY